MEPESKIKARKREIILEIGKASFKKIIDPFYIGGAAELAFWLLLSLVPATILLAQVLQLFTISMEAARNILIAYVSEEIIALVEPLLSYNPYKSLTIVLILLALFAGSSAVFTLMRVINRAYGLVPGEGNPIAWIVMERLRSLLVTLLVIITLVFALYILVFGELFVQAALSYNNVFLGRELTFSEVWYGVRWVIAFVLFLFTALTLYSIMPRARMAPEERASSRKHSVKVVLKAWAASRNRALRYALPGSVFAAVFMLVITGIYTQYTRHYTFENFTILYGGLSSVVVLLLWFYFMSYVVITGVQINAAFAEYINKRNDDSSVIINDDSSVIVSDDKDDKGDIYDDN
jgi:membrane protein